MDDEELTQDILDQFDLICTQQQLQNVNVSNVSVDRFSSLVLRGNAPEFSNDVQSSLSRTSSLDRRKVKNPEAFADRTVESPAVIERLNREVASLREELYMKLGELATLKDSSSRTNALKSDAIVRLENSLACQREEFQRKISELTAQLASKEADYRTVTTELTLVREQFSNVRLPVAQDRSNDFSPASQLIASMVTSPFGSATPNGMPNKAHQPSFGSPSNDHLPAPVTPVPSRRRPLMGGTWRLDHLNRCDPTNRTYVTPRYHEEPSMQQALPINTVESTQYCQQEGEGIPRKRRRQNRSFSGSPVVSEIDDRVKPMVDTAVETDPLMQALPTSSVGPLRCRSNVLRFGLAYSGCFTEPSGLHGLASSLLSINMTALNTDSEILARNKENVAPLTVNGRSPIATDVPSTNIFSDVLDTDDYLFGLSSLVSGDCDGTFGSYEKEITQNELGAITKKALNAVPHLLKNIEKSIQSLSALRWKREPSPLDPSGDTDKSCAQRMEEIGQPPKLNPSVLCPTDDGGISYLGEDPFAGAPASQMVAPLINPPSRSGFSRSPANPFHTPGQLFLSAPADFHSVVTADSSQTNSTLPLPLPVRTSLEQGIRGLKRIQCLLKALQSWRLSSSGEPNNNHSSVHTDLQMLSVTISDLITRLVNGLAEFILWRFLQNSLPSHSVVSSNIHVLPYQQSATQSQSGFQLSSAGLNSAQPDSSIPEEIGHYLTRLSEMSLNLAALAACCVDSVKSETESNSAKFEWKLSPVNCMIIAVGISYSSEIDRGAGNPVEMSDWHLSSTSNEGSKEILFVQLLRYMLSRGHWDLGHQDLDWSTQWLGGPTCTSRGEISAMASFSKKDIVLAFHDLGVVKFGEFRLKSGVLSPIYLDLRLIISVPQLMCMAVQENLPMVMCRKEAKSYGTKQLVEGTWKPGQQCLVIEDVITSGSSLAGVVEAPVAPQSIAFYPRMKAKLDQLIQSKSTQLCVAIDTNDSTYLLKMADKLGPKICALKLHLDILQFDCSPDPFIDQLRGLATKHGFLIVEDRKLADIGQTVFNQLHYGIFHIAEWCDLVTVHGLPGPGIFDAFRKINARLAEKGDSAHHVGALVVAQLSSKDNLADVAYGTRCVEMCKSHTDIVAGFVTQNPVMPAGFTTASFYYWVPGVRTDTMTDQLGQNYACPSKVLKRFPTNSSGQTNVIMIVGRGITEALEPVAAAEEYRKASISSQ
ncbi:Orotidine 5'-phosphate decarboxylase [Fasciola hepatica]|uniref:Orotidine 5'-phosphate decarboxylase n=1 Tax=Fasciola hepatica TaxID=6192 RepID=A0A4E0RB51_FASHE|nr:Orotidine 5'-phosphate decarboxylase [Fasciola hepatica]